MKKYFIYETIEIVETRSGYKLVWINDDKTSGAPAKCYIFKSLIAAISFIDKNCR